MFNGHSDLSTIHGHNNESLPMISRYSEVSFKLAEESLVKNSAPEKQSLKSRKSSKQKGNKADNSKKVGVQMVKQPKRIARKENVQKERLYKRSEEVPCLRLSMPVKSNVVSKVKKQQMPA